MLTYCFCTIDILNCALKLSGDLSSHESFYILRAKSSDHRQDSKRDAHEIDGFETTRVGLGCGCSNSRLNLGCDTWHSKQGTTCTVLNCIEEER